VPTEILGDEYALHQFEGQDDYVEMDVSVSVDCARRCTAAYGFLRRPGNTGKAAAPEHPAVA
jgi:hypothetical protein